MIACHLLLKLLSTGTKDRRSHLNKITVLLHPIKIRSLAHRVRVQPGVGVANPDRRLTPPDVHLVLVLVRHSEFVLPPQPLLVLAKVCQAPSDIVEYGVLARLGVEHIEVEQAAEVGVWAQASGPNSLSQSCCSIQDQSPRPNKLKISFRQQSVGSPPARPEGRGWPGAPPGGMRERQGSDWREAPRRSKSLG